MEFLRSIDLFPKAIDDFRVKVCLVYELFALPPLTLLFYKKLTVNFFDFFYVSLRQLLVR